MIRVSPQFRISFGLVLLTISILLVGDLFGLVPNRADALLDARKKVCESLAVLFSSAAQKNDFSSIEESIRAAVARNDDILSAAARTAKGELLIAAGDHQRHWGDFSSEHSTSTHVFVPIFQGDQKWGSVEVRFASITLADPIGYLRNSMAGLLIYVAIAGFLAYLFMIRRVLTVLNPTGAVPDRVKSAFDTLTEGVLLLDESGLIILANDAFMDKTGKSEEALVGKNPADFDWQQRRADESNQKFPWALALEEGKTQAGHALTLKTDSDVITFMVNGAPILDEAGKGRGVLVSFDDVTVLEKKNTDLKKALGKLKKTQEIITRQNEELQFLVSRDPLTGSLNRRAFFEEFEAAFTTARQNNEPLSCIMVDIDHFKAVNDNHGHSMGDDVIILVAKVLENFSRSEDRVGRYGGEEFCVFLPNTTIEQAALVAENLRSNLFSEAKEEYKSVLRITASLGVSCISDAVATPGELVNQADNALYVAKETGRNRVIQFSEDGSASARAQIDVHEEQANEAFLFEKSEAHDVESEEVKALKERVLELEVAIEKNTLELEYKSGHDEVTELPNRLLFHDRIEQALIRGKRFRTIFAVLSIELDMFKRINNTLGHVVGDKVLRCVAERLAKELRGLDTVAVMGGSDEGDSTVSRIGGDEFGVLLSDLDKIDSVTWIVKRIIRSLTERMEIDGHNIFINCSIGISLYPNDGETAESLIRSASMARHHSKYQLGRNKYQFYSEEINEVSLKQIKLEAELQTAIEREEFILHYQPKVDLRTGKISGMEALVRWQSPKRGLVPPFHFIPIAEQTGLISQIGEWVIKTACSQVKTWLEMGIENARVAVNLSVVQLRKRDFAERLIALLQEHEVPLQYIELEITESVIMQNITTAVDTIEKLHDAGIKISLDDFGTGYSSLSYLKRLPIDTVKLDRSFISEITTDTNDAAIVSSMIELSHSMGLKVIAEGVETQEQLDLIRSLNCDELQGYLFSKPVIAADATAMLKDNVVMRLVE